MLAIRHALISRYNTRNKHAAHEVALRRDPVTGEEFDVVDYREQAHALAPDDVRAIRQALRRIPLRYRQAIRLHHLDGLTLAASGEVMGITKERVRQLCNKGMRLLAEMRSLQEVVG